MRILSIGNSFSEDAQRYLNGVAKASGVSLTCFNLMIGGCSLERHYRNMLSGGEVYRLQHNGEDTGFSTSLAEALLSGSWDIITLQQVSSLSCRYESYMPYLSALADFVRRYQPGAKLFMHETWAYEDGSQRLTEELGYRASRDMLRDIMASYRRAAADIRADGLIPSGELLAALQEGGIGKLHRDTYHAALGVTRYALSLLWTHVLTGAEIRGNGFADLDVPMTDKERQIAEEVAASFTLVTDFSYEGEKTCSF